MSGRSYEGPSIDGSGQYLSEAPYWQGTGETVGVPTTRPWLGSFPFHGDGVR